MLSACFNPACRKELHYLRTGRIVRITRNLEAHPVIEHFWLCGNCCAQFEFKFDGNGNVALSPRNPILNIPLETHASL